MPSRRQRRQTGPKYRPILAYPTYLASGLTTAAPNSRSPNSTLYAPPLLGTTSVVRKRRNIFNRMNSHPGTLQSGYRRISAAARPLHADFHFNESKLLGSGDDLLDRALGCEWCTFPRALEPHRSGGCPTQDVAVHVGHGNQCIIKRRLYVRDTACHTTTNSTFSRSFSHLSILDSSVVPSRPFCPPRSSWDPFAFGRLFAYAAREPEDACGDEYRDST